MNRPLPDLQPGGRIGVVATAGPVPAAALARGIAWLRDRGYEVVPGTALRRRHGYLAGDDAARRDDLNLMLRRRDLQAIWFARGGYGSARLLDGIDFAAARRYPKRWIGYSDLTALQLALWKRTGLPSFYGPMVVELGERPPRYHLGSLMPALTGDRFPAWTFGRRQVVRPGRGAGRLIGGCLSVFCSLLGTRWEPDCDGAILFWEEVGEEPFRIDRYLFQLRQAGKFRRLRGMMVGRLVDCTPQGGRPALPLRDILADALAGTRFPVITGLPFGHGPANRTVPIGYRAVLNTAAGTIRITAP